MRSLLTHGFLTVPRRMLADSIDVRGDPLSDMSALTGVFAMKGERVYQQPR
jgi:hypothetical protein